MQSNTSETTERDMVAAAGHDYLGKSRLKTAPPIQKRLIQYYKVFFGLTGCLIGWRLG